MKPEEDKSPDTKGNYIFFGGEELPLVHHPTDFSIAQSPSSVREKLSNISDVRHLAAGVSRVVTQNPEQREELMAKVRSADPKSAAHHIYQLENTREEIVIADRIYLTLEDDHPDRLKAILDEFPELEEKKQIGKTHVLLVTDRTTRNPLKIANQIAEIDGVECCKPKILPPVQRNSGLDPKALADKHKLFDRQWHLTPQPAAPDASINCHLAWAKSLEDPKVAKAFGDPKIVIAVIDDGFDLPNPPSFCHPVFDRKSLSDQGKNLAADNEPGPFSRESDFHGTPVASIATASRAANGMLGVAPDCTFLPVRIDLGSNVDLEAVLEALEIASKFADVVNCSFNLPPLSVDFVGENCWFVESVEEMTKTGGRRGKGLVIVFSAGNSDAPTFLSAEENKQGIRFAQGTGILTPGHLKAGVKIHSGFPEIPGVVVVGAMSSHKRKAGYSNWGPHLTVTAPSDNGHDMLHLGTEDRKDFEVDYPGLGLVAAVNTEGHGLDHGLGNFKPLDGTLGIPDFDDHFYTEGFGRTSGAAAIVTGVVALMLSVNDSLTAAEVIEILKTEADKTGLLMDLDLKNDPNLAGFSGDFVGDHSAFFGAGKVDAGRAVQRALDLRPKATQPAAALSPLVPTKPTPDPET